mmetsp:Transcript_18043/g.30311  ORF Transcript_18043/g.30311 Transcript_18043/m.30311 type:complete len:312 (+) Transcript_18043:133-1068(+)
MPPQGAWMKAGWQLLVHTTPTRRARATRRQRAASAENTAPARPYSLWFAAATASSSAENSRTHSTGPKTSCCQIALSMGTSVNTVGGKKYPPPVEVDARRADTSPSYATAYPAAFAWSTRPLTLLYWPRETSGPIKAHSGSETNGSLKGSPIFKSGSRSKSRFMTFSLILACSNTRDVAEHIWPAFHRIPVMIQSTVALTSASSNTIRGLFPPSSRDTARGPSAAAAIIFCAVGTLPVNDNLSMPGWLLSGPPASGPRPETTFSAPAGSPASMHNSPSNKQDRGANSDGFSIIAHPAAILGITFQIPMRNG